MMGGGGGGGGDAERWLTTAQKLLLSGDLNGSKTYAIRACEADHSLVDPAELILAVADTLIAGESRIRGSTTDLPDWYAVLRLVRLTHNPELVATQYSRLAVLLDPSRNRFPYSDQAFRLISDAWYVLSDPARKALYDRELHLSQFGQLGQLGFQLFNQPPQSPQEQHSPQSFQSQQLPFQFRQQVMQQPFVQEHSEMVRSGGSSTSSGRDWKLAVEDERCINLNNATERVQSQYEEPSTSSTEWTWSSKPNPTTTETNVHWQSSEPSRQFQSEAAQLSLLPLVSDQPQSNRSNQSHSVSKPQPVSKPFPVSQQESNHFLMSKQTPVSKHLPVSQPPPTSNPFPVSQPKSNTKLPVTQRQLPPTSSTVSQPHLTSKLLSTSQPPTTCKPFPMSQQPSNTFLISKQAPSSKPFSVSQSSQNSKTYPVVSQQPSNPFPMSKQPPASKLFSVSQPSPTSNPFPVSQPTPNTKTKPLLPVSQSQPPSTSSKPLPMASQPPTTSKPLPVSKPLTTSNLLPTSKPTPNTKSLPVVSQPQPPPTSSNSLPVVSQPPTTSVVSHPPQQTFQSTSHLQRPEASGAPTPQPPLSNSTQSFQPPPVPAVSTNQSPPPPPPVSQPTWVPNTEQISENGTVSCDSDPKIPSFWTTCPYCFVLYEYPNMYEESVLKCQTKTCRRAFQAVKVPSPPLVNEKDSYYCCWGFYPIGFAEVVKFPVNDSPQAAPRGFFPVNDLPKAAPPRGFPVNDLPRTAPKKPSPKVYYVDDDDYDSYIDSDPSEDEDDDDDWEMSGAKRRKNVKQEASAKPKRGRPRKVIQVD